MTGWFSSRLDRSLLRGVVLAVSASVTAGALMASMASGQVTTIGDEEFAQVEDAVSGIGGERAGSRQAAWGCEAWAAHADCIAPRIHSYDEMYAAVFTGQSFASRGEIDYRFVACATLDPRKDGSVKFDCDPGNVALGGRIERRPYQAASEWRAAGPTASTHYTYGKGYW